jgi:predicted GIY-YIG superfamily endonuclease
MEFNYVLLLRFAKIYVGHSNDPIERLIKHALGTGAQWPKKYEPVDILDIQKGTKDDENILTLECMLRWGWKNVRGGYWPKVNMNKPPRALLEYAITKFGYIPDYVYHGESPFDI